MRRSDWGSLALAASLGALHSAAFAPWPAWWLQILTMAAGLYLVRSAQAAGAAKAALAAFAFGMGHFGVGLCWLHISMHRYGGMPWLMAAAAVLAFAAYLSVFGVLAGLLAHPRRDRLQATGFAPSLVWAGAIAGAWTLGEVARGWLFTGFPWLSVGYTHVDGPLQGLAPLVGVYGVGLAAVWVSALLAAAPWRSDRRTTIRITLLACATLALAWPLSWLRFTDPSGPPVSVRLVQGNVGQQLKFDPQRSLAAMQAYARHIERSPAALTVLPETAWTTLWSSTPEPIAAAILGHVRARSVAVAIGLPALESAASQPRITNSVQLFSGEAGRSGDTARYDKHHLVPFGEFVPWGFEWFVTMMRIPLGSFARGAIDQPPFVVAGQRFAINICYEDLFGEEIIAAVREPVNASVLVNVSNIAWFGDSHALPQHLEIARMRARETGRPMLRATNTGVTASIDAQARVLAQLPHETEGVLDVAVQATRGLTPYVRWGNLPVIALSGAIVLLTWALRRRQAAIQ